MSSTPSPLPQPGTKIEIRPVTSVADIPTLAKISELALKDDTLFEFRARCGAKPIYEGTMEKLTAAVNNPARFKLFKAVVVPATAADGNVDQDETIVGYTQWMLGYLETPKMDPFAPKHQSSESDASTTSEPNALNITTSEANEKQADDVVSALEAISLDNTPKKSKPYYSNPDQEHSRKMGNAYITAIRGKRHLCLHRLIVHPSYQRQGIGQKLLDWGIETADRENVVSWLFSRPAGSKLYERNGWTVYTIVGFERLDENLYVPPSAAMLRLPRAARA